MFDKTHMGNKPHLLELLQEVLEFEALYASIQANDVKSKTVGAVCW